MLVASAILSLFAATAAAVKPLKIEGSNFVDDADNRFQIVGMAYQPGGAAGFDYGSDPLSEPEQCMRDAALMQILGVNAIRVYNLDPDVDHDECASIFNAAGMYMMLDVNSPKPGDAINREEPWTSYHEGYLNRTFAIVEAFSNYPNTLAFFSANEVIDTVPSAKHVPPYLRAVTRDIKNYIKNNIDRQIPVGYSAADVRDVLWDTYNYVACLEDGDEDDMSVADFFALNSYSWCGEDATFETSSFDDLVEGFKDSPVPIFFSEYGCNETPERYWKEVHSIYGPDMWDVFSGGVVYEYTMEDNDYGLVQLAKNDPTDEAEILSDYTRLRKELGDIDWESVQTRNLVDTGKYVECSPKLITQDGFKDNFTLPELPPGAAELIKDGISPKPKGRLVEIDDWDVTLPVVGTDGNTLTNLAVEPLEGSEHNWNGKNEGETGGSDDGDSDNSDDSDSDGGDDGDDEGAASMAQPMMLAAAVPLVAMLFA